jgi:hypothetical protein
MSAFELQGSSSDGAERSIDGSMAADAINWRPLGELFLEHGLITRDELEEALSVQAETKERLGQVLVTKGLVSRPELLKVLVDQLGLELEHEGVPGPLAHDVAKRRAARGLAAVPENGDAADDGSAADPDPIAAARASFEAALIEERKQLEVPLDEARAELQASLAPPAPEPAVPDRAESVDPAPPDAPASASAPELRETAGPSPVDVTLLVRQADELREQLARESASRVEAVERTKRELDSQVAELQAALSHERELHQRAAKELERAQHDARRQASELRAAVNRLRAELAQVDAATGWFEYWSGAADRSRA